MFRKQVPRKPISLLPLLALGAAALFAACGKPEMDCQSESGRAAIVKAVDEALNTADCATAIEAIEPYYELAGCDTDDIRMARATAYACAANVNFFGLINNLTSANLAGTGLFTTMTQLFPSVSTDSRVTAGQYSLDSFFAMKLPGTITPAAYLVNAGTLHEGTLIAANRTEDSNFGTMLVSMSLMGSLQNRYGAPDSSFQKTHALGRTVGNANGWMDAKFVDLDACTYAGSVLTFVDSVGQVGGSIGGSSGLGTALSTVATALQVGLDLACENGCQGAGGVPSGCSFPAGSCTPCPITLRNRFSCTGLTTNKESCAAAGIIDFINKNALLGWPGPL